jgi:hypothetical protein
MDKAKASLQVMAVEIGTALIPAVSKVVTWVSKVHWCSLWFDRCLVPYRGGCSRVGG